MSIQSRNTEVSLLALRVSIAAVMLVWSFDKLVRPGHSVRVFEGFYAMPGVAENVIVALGIAQLLLVLVFLAGYAKTWSYGVILLLHAGSTFSSWRQYLDPYEGANILFFAAWPMLAACFALFMMRAQDRLLSFGR